MLRPLLAGLAVLVGVWTGCDSTTPPQSSTPTIADSREAADEILETANRVVLKNERLSQAVMFSTGTSCVIAAHEAAAAIRTNDQAFESTAAGQAFTNINLGDENKRDAIGVFVIDWGPEVLLKHIQATERLVDQALRNCD